MIDEVGYHVRDYFLNQPERFRDTPRAIMAHSTHVKGTGTFENGIETSRVEVILATRIPKERCKRIKLGYLDPDSIQLSDYQDREGDGILFVPNAGEMLYRVMKNE
jgi:hypothetical protein